MNISHVTVERIVPREHFGANMTFFRRLRKAPDFPFFTVDQVLLIVAIAWKCRRADLANKSRRAFTMIVISMVVEGFPNGVSFWAEVTLKV